MFRYSSMTFGSTVFRPTSVMNHCAYVSLCELCLWLCAACWVLMLNSWSCRRMNRFMHYVNTVDVHTHILQILCSLPYRTTPLFEFYLLFDISCSPATLPVSCTVGKLGQAVSYRKWGSDCQQPNRSSCEQRSPAGRTVTVIKHERAKTFLSSSVLHSNLMLSLIFSSCCLCSSPLVLFSMLGSHVIPCLLHVELDCVFLHLSHYCFSVFALFVAPG